MSDTYLPRSGAMPRPASVAEAAEALAREAFPAHDAQRVEFDATEFTSLCPRSGQPDFCRVRIEYEPDQMMLESKALKFYLWSFRDEAHFTEAVAAQIANDIAAAIRPKWLMVEVTQNVRGGIGLKAVAYRHAESTDVAA
jgi:7-cyano-7-deazaguanine reductase